MQGMNKQGRMWQQAETSVRQHQELLSSSSTSACSPTTAGFDPGSPFPSWQCQRCGSANNFAMKGKRKTLNAGDVLSAMEEMEFQRFVAPLKESLEVYRREQKGKKEARKDKDKKADSEEQDKSREEDNDDDDERMEEEEQNDEEEVDN
ncbi:DNA polymerase epsilon 3, accessory subunit [Turdus rufiventris]|nr:DNA polymerase epsilon 3, accessory subunit [Turdus rufiventris]